MDLKINWNNPVLPGVLYITTADLDDFYASASEADRLNLFFVLLTTLHTHEAEPEAAAHLCFLIAYYLFVPLTPPGAQTLALHYIRRAMELNPGDEYQTWMTLMEKEN